MFYSAKRLIAAFSITVLAGVATAGEEVYFQSNFAGNKTLKGWHDIWDQRGTKPVRAEIYKVVEENGDVFFRSEKTANGKLIPLWGIWHRLGKNGITVDDKITEIQLEAVLRKKAVHKNYNVGVGITSNLWCDTGRAFMPGKQDSGIEILGTESPIHQKLSSISTKVSGTMTTLVPPRKPYNFLTKVDAWVTWKMVYDNIKKEVRFYRSAEETTPFIVKHAVDMNGIVLQSVWLSGGAAEFKSVKVTVKTK